MTPDEEKVHRYDPDFVLPPGETLAEVLEALGMTQTELAKRTGLSVKHINQIVKGSAPISPETSLALEKATKTPGHVWNALEMAYREHLSRRDEEKDLEADIGWLAELPIKQLIKRGSLAKGSTPVDQVRKVCEFFGVANRAAWETLWQKPTAYRRSQAFVSDPGAVAAWLRIGEIRAADIPCANFDRARLVDRLLKIRALTREPDPKVWESPLVEMCAAAGVAVVFEPEVKGARINGAARWLSPEKALIQLSLRHHWSDIFWFTFFHEAGHLILHSKKETFINDIGQHSGVEQEADAFAAQVLIPRELEPDLSYVQTVDDARAFAERAGIAPGIVVGRLQHEDRWPFSKGNILKHRFVFSSPAAG